MRQYSIWPGHYAVIVPRQLRAPPGRRRLGRARMYAGGFASGPESVAANGPMSARVRVVRDRGDTEYRALSDPEQVLLVAAGGPAGGFGAVIPPWFGGKRPSRRKSVPTCASTPSAPGHYAVIVRPGAELRTHGSGRRRLRSSNASTEGVARKDGRHHFERKGRDGSLLRPPGDRAPCPLRRCKRGAAGQAQPQRRRCRPSRQSWMKRRPGMPQSRGSGTEEAARRAVCMTRSRPNASGFQPWG